MLSALNSLDEGKTITYATNTSPSIHVVMSENGQHINGGLAWET